MFERYDLEFKGSFGFEKEMKRDVSMRMPLRFIWGIRPVDNGDHLNPGGDKLQEPAVNEWGEFGGRCIEL